MTETTQMLQSVEINKMFQLAENLTKSNMEINKLPDDCLRAIFTRVPMSELIFLHNVCPRWNQVLKDFLEPYVELCLFQRNYQLMGINLKTYEKDCLYNDFYPPIGPANVEIPDFSWENQNNAQLTAIFNRLPIVFTGNIRKLEIRGVTLPIPLLATVLGNWRNIEYLSIFLDNLPFKKSFITAYHIIKAANSQSLRHLTITLGGNSCQDIAISDNDLEKFYIDENILNSLESLYICDYSKSPNKTSIIKFSKHLCFNKIRHLAIAHNDHFFSYLSRLDGNSDFFKNSKSTILTTLTHLTLHNNHLKETTSISLMPFVNLKKLSLSFSIWPTQNQRFRFILNYLTNIPKSLKHLCLNIIPNTLSLDFFPRDLSSNNFSPIQTFEIIEIDCSRINNTEIELYPLLDVFKNWTKLRINEKTYVVDEFEKQGFRLVPNYKLYVKTSDLSL